MLDANNFVSMRVGLASPETIRKWSHGEVTKPETINYRTQKPERDGLFCEKIFGPTKDWECHCGKYKRIRYKGIVCEKCGVEVTKKDVRRERMGHIELAAPVSHIWYFKGIPSRMSLILDVSPKNLEKVLYFVNYIVTDPKDVKDLHKLDLMDDFQYMAAVEKYGADAFDAGMGAEAIQKLLKEIDLDKLSAELREELKNSSGQKKARAVRRLEACESFRKSGNRPEWMILEALPVIPPDLRPMVALDGGRYATSDLNDLYRRVLNRNNRLRRLLELHSPSIMIRNEKRMLQEAVDALIDNGRRGRAVTGPGNRELKSLSDMLKGKQGRFRQNLLGKRVDYSGRSVIVVGPELKMHQCGLPKEMALELFKPFVMKRLITAGKANNIKSAKRMVERATNDVWDMLEQVIKEHPVLLNRAPTLHRLGIQAFEPILSEGRAIKLHPLVCTAFNADFDGDQMAVHLPLSVEAQAEARMLMLSVNNILAPKEGKPIAVPTQDMVLGAYYMTILREDGKGQGFGMGKMFCNRDEAELAYYNHEVGLQAPIKVYIPQCDIDDALSPVGAPASTNKKMVLVDTSVGSIIYNYALPTKMRYFLKEENGWRLGKLIDKKELGKLVGKAHKLYGNLGTAEVLDIVKSMGYDYACLAGLSIATSDIRVPEVKKQILEDTEVQVEKVAKLYRKGLLTNQERYEKSIALWDEAKNQVTSALLQHTMDKFNSVNMMATSGARGNQQQMAQLAGMVGLKQDTSSRTIERPVKANFREGLTILEYFISSHGARKGLADTALRTANSGYLTRRLVDVSQDVIVREDDCDVELFDITKEYAAVVRQGLGMGMDKVKQKYIGRTTAITKVNDKGEILYESDVEITSENFDKFVAAGAETLVLRKEVVDENGEKTTSDEQEEVVISMKRETVLAKLQEVIDERFFKHEEHQLEVADDVVDGLGTVVIPAGTKFDKKLVETVLADSTITEFSVRHNDIPGIYVTAITKKDNGENRLIESLEDRIIGRHLAEDIKGESGTVYTTNSYITDDMAKDICAANEKVKIRSVLGCKSKFGVCRKCYGKNLATGKIVDIGEAVGIIAAQSIGEPGTQLTMRTFHTGGVAGAEDITQGLPRVEEVFEARKPKSNGIVAEIGGKVSFAEVENEKDKIHRRLIITPKDGEPKEYLISSAIMPRVNEGDVIEVGTQLTPGSLDPHDVLRVSGVRAAQDYLVSEVVTEYHTQGVDINSKHIEVIVRQMMRKTRIDECGDTDMLPGSDVDNAEFKRVNAEAVEKGLEPATGHEIMLGITKASLATDSFLSAASFQETTRVLTGAAIQGKVDPLQGVKENVIIGKLIPAGTGLAHYRNVSVKKND